MNQLIMRLLGIDYGTKRVGVALSDESGRFAFPYQVLENTKRLAEEIEAICVKEKVTRIVLGESRDYKQQPNPIMKEILKLRDELASRIGLAVELEPEFLTSAEAERLQGKNDMLDASAAALILKSYIDRHEHD